MTVVGKVTVRGTELAIDVTSHGLFWLKQGDQTIASGETLEAAKTKAGVELNRRKVKVSVPFAMVDGRRGIADSMHARNQTVLATIGGERHEFSRYGGGRDEVFDESITDEELTRIRKIDDEIEKLQNERYNIVKAHELNLAKRVQKAIEEKVEAESS